MTTITIALSKGRIFDETLPLLAEAGIVPTENPETSRKLIIETNQPNVRVVIVRASDVPTYVQYGAADIGVAGKDVLIEHGGEGLYSPLDLKIAKCRMMVAVPEGFDYENAVRQGARLKVDESSPRPWGCFQRSTHGFEQRIVFPTPLGVFPSRAKRH